MVEYSISDAIAKSDIFISIQSKDSELIPWMNFRGFYWVFIGIKELL